MRRGRVLGIPAALATLAIAAGCGGDDRDAGAATALERPGASERTAASVPELYRQVEPSVVAVLVRGEGGGGGEGSGVIVRPDKIVTNDHVVRGADDVRVALASGERLQARVVARDPLTDLAVLDVDRDDLPVARIADRVPPIGSQAVAIGNPLGFESSVTAGILSGVDRAVPSGGRTPALVNLLQTDAPISPGNSGGALVGPEGGVIGINVAYIPPQARAESIGFAIPAPTVRAVVDELLADGQVDHPYLGVQLRPVTPAISEQLGLPADGGAAVTVVEEGSPADRGGLLPGDVVTRIGDRRVESVEDVLAELREGRPGRRIALEAIRDGERRALTVTPGERPSAAR